MPLYEYQCAACDKRFEVIQKFSDPAVETCKVCGKGPVQRLLSSPAIQFKGSGWYITDYAKKGTADTSDKGAASASDGKSGDAKTDTAAKTDSTAKSDAPATPAASSTTTSKD